MNGELQVNCLANSSPKVFETPIDIIEKIGKIKMGFSLRNVSNTYAFNNYSEYVYAEC